MPSIGRIHNASPATSYASSTSGGSFHIVRREDAQGTSLQVLGRLVRGHGARWDAWAPVFGTFATGPIRLDLAGVTDLDAAGLGVLARLVRRARYRGRACAVVAAPPRVRRLLAATRLDGPLGARSGIVDSARSRSIYG